MEKTQINPHTVAHIAATLAVQNENMRSDGDLIDLGLKPNRYREARIRELCELSYDFVKTSKMVCFERIKEENGL